METDPNSGRYDIGGKRGSRKSGKRAEQIRVGRGRAENEQNRSGTVEEEQKTNKTDQGQVISEFYRDSIEDWVNHYG